MGGVDQTPFLTARLTRRIEETPVPSRCPLTGKMGWDEWDKLLLGTR